MEPRIEHDGMQRAPQPSEASAGTHAAQTMGDSAAVLAQLAQAGAQKVKVAVADIDGVLRGKYLHIDKFKSALKNGFGFCSVIFGWDSADQAYGKSTYTGWHTGYPDTLARVDPSTFRTIPWENNLGFFLADFYEQDGETPLAICPRQLLKKVLAKLAARGMQVLAGCEFEWFNFKENGESLQAKNYTAPQPLTPGMFGYSLTRAGQNRAYFNELMDLLYAFDLPIEGLHTETGPGVYEAAIKACEALVAADRATLFKSATKEIAHRHGILPSFMARWNNELPGCSGHIHLSLNKDERNLFYDSSDSNGMSPLFKNFLAGLIKYTPEFLPMMAPTVNSYKRLVKGYWAPTTTSWGHDNRTCAFRVITGSPSATRVEVRVPGADMNPYLAMAAAVSAGFAGIEEKLPLTQPAVVGNAYDRHELPAFPSSLLAATEKFSASEAAHAILGKSFVQHFSETRLWEWEQAQRAVTDWEIKRYFEII